METFVTMIFALFTIEGILKLMNIISGQWSEERKFEVYVVDTLITAILAVWAGFTLWY